MSLARLLRLSGHLHLLSIAVRVGRAYAGDDLADVSHLVASHRCSSATQLKASANAGVDLVHCPDGSYREPCADVV